jgi:hypothetical protein
MSRFLERPLEEGRGLLIVLDDQHAHVRKSPEATASDATARARDKPR